MGAIKAACLISLAVLLALFAAFQLEQRDQIAALERRASHQYELIVSLKGDILALQQTQQIKRNLRTKEKE
jgi:hypothetical protein